MANAYVVMTAEGAVAWRESTNGVQACTLPAPTLATAKARIGGAARVVVPADHELARRLAAYFEGDDVSFDDVPLDLPDETPFQAAVRRVVRAIPRGEVRTYGEVAAAAGRPRAARAVGQVMATNPVPPIVPCHRVVAVGGLGGFGGGLDLKRRMLAREGAPCARS